VSLVFRFNVFDLTMPSTSEALQTAYAHHQAGHLREAEEIYRRILQAEPNHADSLHLLGLVAYQVGRAETAVELIGRAVGLRADQPVFRGNLGEALRACGRAAEAELCLLEALRLDPTLADAHNSLGNVRRAAGRDDDAVTSFRRAIALRPTFAEAHNNLGTVLQTQGHLSAAISAYREALQLNPRYVDAWLNLGTAWRAHGNGLEAARSYRQALQLAPNNSEAHLNLGTVHQDQRELDEAAECYRKAVALDPRSVTAHSNLGAALKDLKQFDEAIASLRTAIGLDPRHVDAHFNLAAVWHAEEKWAQAAAAYDDVLRLQGDHAKALASLGTVLQHQGRIDESLALLNRAIEIDPDYASAYLNRANVYRLQRRTSEAVEGYETALRLQPEFPEAYNNLAVLFNDVDQPDLAVQCCRRGIKQDPNSGALYANLATAMQNLGQLDEAIQYARKSVELQPDAVGAHTNLLYKLNFNPDYDAATIFQEHLEWARRHAEPLTAQARGHSNDRSRDRRLRIGYVSPYFRDHAVNFFSEPMISAHDHQDFEIFCYSDAAIVDAATERLRPTVDHWRETRFQTDQELAETIRGDAIDILVDLTGHIAGNRLLTFARRPAPIQVTYLGYQNTTGMSAMDYRLTDAWSDPPGQTDAFYTEKLVRLPGAFFCYRPSEAPAVSPLPALNAGHVTFGSFNNFAKVSPGALETWLKILNTVAGSRLMILAHGGGSLAARVGQLAESQGIDPARIEFCEKRPRPAYLELMSQVDIALDPFPFNGHTTSCDALWMGLPVVMLAGQSYSSRFGGSVLNQVGLGHLLSESPAEYVDIAARLAADVDALARLRKTLRDAMAGSALLDAAGFTRNLEAAYRQMWHKWCAA
jgi:predicted O-linked N-acetylglucosamine transferase (SPINDLY family)